MQKNLLREALTVFYEVRDVPGLKKKPSTSELLDWIKLLLVEDISPEALRERDPGKLIPPLHGALLKNEQDVQLLRAPGLPAPPRARLDLMFDRLSSSSCVQAQGAGVAARNT